MRDSDRAYKALLGEIMEGQLPPGSVLAKVDQASRLGISRTPLREALYRLYADGLLTNPSGREATVTGISTESAHEIYDVRRALEESAARLAAQKKGKTIFSELAQEFRNARDSLTLEDNAVTEFYDLNRRFDEAIDKTVANEYLASALLTIRKHAARLRRVARHDIQRLRASAAETATICDAVFLGNQELAAHATHVHLHNSLAHVIRTFRQNPSQKRQQ